MRAGQRTRPSSHLRARPDISDRRADAPDVEAEDSFPRSFYDAVLQQRTSCRMRLVGVRTGTVSDIEDATLCRKMN